MKKALIFSLIFGFLFFLNFEDVSHAQVKEGEISQNEVLVKQINDLQIQILLAKIAELQAMINQILMEQETSRSQNTILGGELPTKCTAIKSQYDSYQEQMADKSSVFEQKKADLVAVKEKKQNPSVTFINNINREIDLVEAQRKLEIAPLSEKAQISQREFAKCK